MIVRLDDMYNYYQNYNYSLECIYETESLLNPNKLWEFTVYDKDDEVILTMKVKNSAKSSVGGIGKQKANQVLGVFGFQI